MDDELGIFERVQIYGYIRQRLNNAYTKTYFTRSRLHFLIRLSMSQFCYSLLIYIDARDEFLRISHRDSPTRVKNKGDL